MMRICLIIMIDVFSEGDWFLRKEIVATVKSMLYTWRPLTTYKQQLPILSLGRNK